jgi:hypothetical protein
MSFSMAYTPEPLHLTAKMDGAYIKVVHGDGAVIVAKTSSRDFIADTIRELKLRGHDHETSVIIYGLCGNFAWNGAIKHHTP